MRVLLSTKKPKPPPSAAGHVSQSKKKTGPAGAGVERQTYRSRNDIETSTRQTAQAKKLGSMFPTPIQQQDEEEELLQGKFPMQRQPMEDEELLQGKFPVQEQPEEEELLQGKFPLQAKPVSNTGIPPDVQAKMEGALNTGLSDVNVHTDSNKATEVGALAYTQGSDIHFAPGQYSLDTSSGKKLLGHELAHVVQQSEGRVPPTGEIAGLPLNDSPALEQEADTIGAKAL
jgi:hypothetical protein